MKVAVLDAQKYNYEIPGTKTVSYGVEPIRYLGPKICKLISDELNKLKSLELFKEKVKKKSVIAPPPPQIRPPADTPLLKKLTKPDRPIKHTYKVSMDKPPADTPSKKSLRNQINLGRHHGFLRYRLTLSCCYCVHIL